jgi:hypothetical protein
LLPLLLDWGDWALLEETKVSDQYQVTLYSEKGEIWVQGRFWSFKKVAVSRNQISHFNGGNLYLKNGAFLLPIGQQSRNYNGRKLTLIYPDPSPEYIDARKFTQRLLDSSTVDQATP